MLNRPRRRGEQGQILIAVLALIAFVGVVSIAALRFLDSAFIQHRHTETTAATNSVAEGAARFAVNTVHNSGAIDCAGPRSGSTAYSPAAGVNDSVSYTVNTCIADYLNSQPGGHCALCILSTDPAALSLNSNAQVMVSGEVVINGGVSVGTNSKLCSTSGPNNTTSGCQGTPGFIGIGGTLPADTSPYTPAPTHVNTILDPLATLPYPTLGQVSLPTLGNGTFNQGTYQGLSVGGGQTATLNPGVYVMTGDVSISGGGKIVATGGVTLFFTCSTAVSRVSLISRACNPGEHGAGLDLSGSGEYRVTAPSTGTYANVAIFYDRNNTGDLTSTIGLKVAGNGTSDVLAGAVYAAAANVDIGGQGGSVFSANGRLVVSMANIHVGASVDALNLVGAHFASSCDLYNATANGSETVGSSVSTRNGQVVFVADPNNVCGGTRIVSFTFTP